jgi:outer membrane autotransporter protein
VTGHNFFADAEVREDFYLMGVSNPAALLNSASLYGVALAANGSVGYRLNLPSSRFIEPSAAFIYSGLHENSLRMNLDASGSSYGTLVFNPFLSALGRAGVRVGTTYVFDNIGLALQPFATGSLWHEFEGDIQTTFELPVTAVSVSITRVGAFGQIGAGLSAQVLKTGLIGYLRGDYRVGPNISGYAVVAGLRYQF